MLKTKKIIHIDLDCFFAAVEIRDNQSLINRPVAVCNSNERSGAVCTCNYIARSYGVRSAMSVKKALMLCPDLVIVPANLEKYKSISKEISSIYYRYTNIVELISLDEAFLDVTESSKLDNIATDIASEIQIAIRLEVGLSASAGVASTKFLAKIASDWKKPGGLFIIKPNQTIQFLNSLPIEKLPGVGPVTAQKLHKLNIRNCHDLKLCSSSTLIQNLGILGRKLVDFSHGIDDRKVEPNVLPKSVSVEQTYAYDIQDCDYLNIINIIFARLLKRLQSYDQKLICKQFVRIRFNNFKLIKKERKVELLDKSTFVALIQEIQLSTKIPIKLIGLGVSFAQVDYHNCQLTLFV